MVEETDFLEDGLEENIGQEFFEHHRIIVDRGQGLLRIDKFLPGRLENVSRSKLQNAAKAGSILVNENPVKSNYKVKPGDVISIVLPHPPREIELIAEDIPIKVVYEDEYLLIIDKEAGMVVHPGYGNYTGTMVNALMFHFKDLPKRDGEDVRPGLVHRIDKNTSGLLVVAKEEVTQMKLAKLFYDHKIERIYNALVWGDFQEEEGTITGHIGRSIRDRKIMDVFPDGKLGKHAITHYRILERFGYVSFVECKLETGRTHQIRAHFRHIGHALFNDDTYGGDRIIKGTTFNKYKQFINNCFKIMPRHALHARTLGFIHPITGEKLFFESPMPSDMSEVLNKWRIYSANRSLFEE